MEQNSVSIDWEKPIKARPAVLDYDLEALPATGKAVVANQPLPNPSHPVRATVKPAEWKQTTPKHPLRFCACGILLPIKVPQRCEACGKPTDRR